ncbi:EAL domain-containing protein [Vibrio coralliilyticus]|uniref:EAL domain-containing protein n=1 Tax=Vibrio coralliilyticus TaxID=190893 RepID=UPI00391755E0
MNYKIQRYLANGREVFAHLPNLFPIAGIFGAVFIVSFIWNYHQTREQAVLDGNHSVTTLENYIDRVASELIVLKKNVSASCSEEDKLALRAHMFHSDMIKEIGLYQGSHVYCTSNEGPTRIRLFSSVLQRISESSNNITISLTKSKSKLNSFFIYVSSDDGTGINALLPPNQFLQQTSSLLDNQHYGYQIQVLSRSIQGQHQISEYMTTPFNFSSQLYPLSVKIQLDTAAYLHHYQQNIWQVVLFAFALSLIYILLRHHTLVRHSIEFCLNKAIDERQIELYLQPIVDIETRNVVGSEALLRWNHPMKGNISPEIFIPLAEKLDLIDDLTRHTFQSVTEFLTENSHNLGNHYISINLSRTSLLKPDFMAFLQSYAEENPAYIQHILIEVTENLDFPAEQLKDALNSLQRISQLGFEVAVDDFGTGYSGLNLIRQHKFNVMKIDKVFINSLGADTHIKPVIQSMVSLAKELNMKIIAEGVENELQISQLNELGVRYIQGFYYSRPIRPEALVEYTVTPFSVRFANRSICY